MNKLYTIQLAVALALSTTSLSVMAQDEHELELTGWQTPLAAEFSRLDTSGNGLLLPNEASKGNAFNKRTFAQADVDRDGYIDQNEYIHFKTGEWPATVKPNQVQLNQVQPDQNQLNQDMPSQDMRIPEQPDANRSNAEPNNTLSMTKDLGNLAFINQQAIVQQNATTTVVNDDAVITHKAIVTLLSTDDLEGMKISVETYLGEVLLSGEVGSQKDKMKAAYVVSKVDGVKSVKNELKVMT